MGKLRHFLRAGQGAEAPNLMGKMGYNWPKTAALLAIKQGQKVNNLNKLQFNALCKSGKGFYVNFMAAPLLNDNGV